MEFDDMKLSNLLPMSTVFLSILLPFILFLINNQRKKWTTSHENRAKVPPGSMGIPVVGQSLTLLWTMKSNTADKWVSDRVNKYGAVSKLSLFGKPTVLIHGQAANKFVFGGNSDQLGNSQTESGKTLMGERNILELSGEDHKRVRGALVSFLKPECLKEYVGKMDQELQTHLQTHWTPAAATQKSITVVPLMKNLTFNIICSLLFGLEHGSRREELLNCFQVLIAGLWSLPINLPFTQYRRSLKASLKITHILKDVIREKKAKLVAAKGSTNEDIIASLISSKVSDEEIIHNMKLMMVAGHDTSSTVLSFIIRLLARDPVVYETLLQEQEEVSRSKGSRVLLTREDLGKMKYTWKVALEILRLVPPLFGGFRRALKDIEYEGFLIPKGWQVLWVSSMTHMDNNIFPDASKFEPSRFDNPGSVPPYSYIPFGAGPRICPGYEFAKIEILVTIHYIVTRFKWKLCCDDNFFGREPMPMPTQGLPIQIVSKE
ncbi:beta-amyrin 28-monooxygenase-like [Impatiens glandulifera]|uniref:beta-amyrin 28-monooxygenase-like n=1 Tax=Impatiens glandulifera TaxID=253017 RepID=UPI001FB18B35|nr:beta-amyrin 28-monooxygenase-like [Impatiens glandulifera]